MELLALVSECSFGERDFAVQISSSLMKHGGDKRVYCKMKAANFDHPLVCSIVFDDGPDGNQVRCSLRISEVLGIKTGDIVSLDILSEAEILAHTVKHAWMRFKNQYTSRISLFLMKEALITSTLTVGQEIDEEKYIWNCRVHKLINEKGETVNSGIIGPETRFCFLSESAKKFIFIEVSSDLIVHENKLRSFLTDLFFKWKETETSHVISFIAVAKSTDDALDRYCVMEDWAIHDDWMTTIDGLINKLSDFAKDLERDEFPIPCPFSNCFFESVNLALNIFNRHHFDRDLTRTGFCITYVSAGTGTFEIKDKHLVELTKRRCLDVGSWIQLVLIGEMPNELSPTFIIDGKPMIPSWIDCDFYGERHKVNFRVSPVKDICLLHAARWDLYPPLIFDPFEKREFQWESLTTPPSLPLSASSLPPSLDDAETYSISSYQIFPLTSGPFARFSGVENEYELIEKLAFEMMLLRLSQGYQLASHQKGSYGLAHGKSYHLIQFSAKECSITVTCFKSNEFVFHSDPSEYSYMLKAIDSSKYSSLKASFANEPFFDWKSLDNFIVGDQKDSPDQFGFWRSRFILIKQNDMQSKKHMFSALKDESFNEIDFEIASFANFMKSIANLMAEKDQRNLSILERLGISLTTSSLPTYIADELSFRKNSEKYQDATITLANIPSDFKEFAHFMPLNKTSTMTEIVEMMQNPLIGLSIKPRRWLFDTYENTFIGAEAVDWMMKFFEDLRSRDEAVEIGTGLIKDNVWEHVDNAHGFIDGHFYYRFTRKFLTSQQKVLSAKKFDPIELSRKIILELDPNSKRPEWVELYYDLVHNPRVAFHFQIKWINCSSRLLDRVIRSWKAKAEEGGFLIIEVPVQPPMPFGPSPFEQSVRIDMAAQPPRVPFLASHWDTILIEEFLVHHNFVLDLEPDCRFPPNPHSRLFKRAAQRQPVENVQYVCRTGQTILQVVRAADNSFYFLWSKNKLAFSQPDFSRRFKGLGLEEFRAICQNKVALENFWNSLVHQLAVDPNSFKSAL